MLESSGKYKMEHSEHSTLNIRFHFKRHKPAFLLLLSVSFNFRLLSVFH